MNLKAEFDVAILGAVPEELNALAELLETLQGFPFRGQRMWFGDYAGLSVLVATTGLGKVNAAVTTASLLEHFPVAQVWHVGCAGAYPDGPLGIGDVLVTEQAFCADEGIITQHGVLPLSTIGIPLVIRNGEEFFDHLPPLWTGSLETIINKTPAGSYRQKRGLPLSRAFPVDPEDRLELPRSRRLNHTANAATAPAEPPETSDQKREDVFKLVRGPSLTVGMASGDPEVADERFRRYGAYAENMEGSAVTQACLRFQIPAVECRGMSNLAGIRTKETWQMEKSIAHCHGIVINWLEALKALKFMT
jgi:futalosine hydrolase